MSFSIRHGSLTPDRFPLIYDLYICEIGQMSTKKTSFKRKPPVIKNSYPVPLHFSYI